jgi:uncharacterized protein (TIGR02246 family)
MRTLQPWPRGRFFDPTRMLLSACVVMAVAAGLFAQAPGAPAAGSKLSAADEAAIRASAEAYAKAYNAADANTLAALWTADAEYVDDLGQEFHGRDAIVRELSSTWSDQPGTKLELTVSSIRQLAPDVALETGTSRAKPAEGNPTPGVKYTAVHVKRDGKWLVSNVTESRHVPATNEPYLQDLAWLEGEWKAEAGGKTTTFQCDWMPNKSFLRRSFTVKEKDQTISSGTQIIGWDPQLVTIVSWTFNSDGGVGRELWSQAGQRWTIEASSTLRDGSTSLATNILMKLDDNTFSWQSVERSLNGDLLPDTAIVRVKRVAR